MRIKVKTIIEILCFMMILSSFILGDTTADNNDTTASLLSYELMIKFQADVSDSDVTSISNEFGFDIIKKRRTIYLIELKVESDSVYKSILNQLKNDTRIKFVEPNYRTKKLSYVITPNDTDFDKQWGIKNIELDRVWDIEKGNDNVIVAVLDSGIDLEHSDLSGRILQGYDFVNGDTVADDDNGHGTLIAGIIGANSNNNIGIAGCNWYCQLLPVKVIGSNGLGNYFDLSEGIYYAVENGAKVLNLSVGGYDYSMILEEAVEYAIEQGCVLIAGVGDDNTRQTMYPAGYGKVIGVASVNSENEINRQTNYGDFIDVYAPGQGIYSTYLNNQYKYESGSSMASAYVSGIVSLLYSINPESNYQSIKNILQNSSDYVDYTTYYETGYGWGKINAYRAVVNHKGIENIDIAIMNVKLIPEQPVKDIENKAIVIIQNQGNKVSEPTELKFTIDNDINQAIEVEALQPNQIVKQELQWIP